MHPDIAAKQILTFPGYTQAIPNMDVKTPTLKRISELDGLRALAIIPVIFLHTYPRDGMWRWLRVVGDAGWMGVDLFFVLSGFLITGILYDTLGERHCYRNFIARRTLRIFPLYFGCLCVFVSLARWFSPSDWDRMNAWGGPWWFFVYLGNVREVWMNSSPPIFSFVPMWSLQVEEQFYLVYPLIVLSLGRSHLKRFLIACVIAAPLIRTCILA